MKHRTIAAVALSSRDFPDFDAKLAEAVQWMELAAKQGAQLIVLPEALNLWRGDGPGNPNAMTFAEAACDDWQAPAQPVIQAARRLGVGVTVPMIVALARC